MASCFLPGRMRIGIIGSGSEAGGNREENAQVGTIRPGKNFPCVDKSRSVRRPTSWNIGHLRTGTLLACGIARPASTRYGAPDVNLFRDGLRTDHERHVPADRWLICQRRCQRDHVAGQQRGAGLSRLRQDVPGGTDAREYPEEPRADGAAIRKALAGATAGRESKDPADHAATDAAKRGQNRPACERLRLKYRATAEGAEASPRQAFFLAAFLASLLLAAATTLASAVFISSSAFFIARA